MIYDWQKHLFLPSDGQFLLEEGGYFETLKIVDGDFKNQDLHLKRLIYGLEQNGYKQYPSFVAVLETARQLLKNPECRNFNVLKLVYFPNQNEVYLQFRTLLYNQADYTDGVHLQVASEVRSYSAKYHYKMTDRKVDLALRKQAQAAGYFEVLYANEQQELIEGTVSNLFMIKAGELYTPPLAKGILNGTMRQAIFQQFSKLIKEVGIQQNELADYDGCFITNALIGIMPVQTITWGDIVHHYDVNQVKQFKI